ncbi:MULTISPECIES: ATP-binding protein [Chryseobacterium]|uniref:ATP-binding protein n=1 Tax=Chryseobacterium TaxID=59732 RepID=UPI001BAF1EF3|nr:MULTISPECIES: ATP-binding protein [Chryseobacterium]QUY53849.1 hypothetical protein I2F65_13235 [Chryseobacterium arthrosphaerae]
MSAIKEIRLYNFKAFYGENKIKLSGKNLLLYGENGSGKSSIYWALYTLLQSVNKENAELNKYFDFTNPENLINKDYLINLDKTLGVGGYDVTVGNNVQVEVELEDGKIFNLSRNGLSSHSDKEVLSHLNRYCDFLTHRLLINFYNFRNSQEIDLWSIFMRDIFPFVYEDLDNGKRTIENLILDLRDTKPFKIEDKKIIELSNEEHSNYYKKISDTNLEIWKWIKQISNESNLFFNKYFQNGENNYKIELKYSNSFFYGKLNIEIKNNGKIQIVESARKFLRTPKILLKVYKKSDDDWILIERPQTYLNEALINQIALAIRLSITAIRAVKYPGQFLALDDILISLDMSNRDKVLDIILDVFAKDYKIYLFTHERSFFNMVKRRLINKNMLEDWNVTEMFMNDFIVPPNPKIVLNQDYLDVALKHLKDFDLPACANYLRKECEFRLKYLLPENLCKKETDSETTYQTLENLIISFLKYFGETLHLDISKYNVLKEKKDLILNPMSHDNLDSEIYKQELVRLYELLLDLRKIEKVLILKCDEQFFFEQVDNTGILRKYKLQAGENLHLYKLQDGNSAHKNIQCKFLECEKEIGTETLNHDAKLKDLQNVAYKHAMQTGGLPSYTDFLEEFKNQDSKTFKQIIIENS